MTAEVRTPGIADGHQLCVCGSLRADGTICGRCGWPMGSIFNWVGSDGRGHMSYMFLPSPQDGTPCPRQDTSGPYTRHIRSLFNSPNCQGDCSNRTCVTPQSSRPPWGDRWGAAGLIVVAKSEHGLLLVCLVDNDKSLGFPKGRAEQEDTSALSTALREWTEETGLPTIHLQMESEPLVHSGPHGDIHYFAGWWDKAAEPSAWRVRDDLHDTSPITHAFWLPLHDVSQLQRFPAYRLELLRSALNRLHLLAFVNPV